MSTLASPHRPPRERWLAPVALCIVMCAGGIWAAGAAASPGDLTQKPGLAACVSDTGAGPCADGTALAYAANVAVSPDGRSAYVVSQVSNAVAVFDRAADGSLTQKPGTAGCVSDTGAGPCADGTALNLASGVAVSPDGQNVYVASYTSGAVAVFDRATDGTLTQKAGTDACVSDDGTGPCIDGTALAGAFDVTVSPDGANVYVASAVSGAVAILARAPGGTLTQSLGACISDTGAGPCFDGRALAGASAVTVSPDGVSVYVASSDADAVAVFDRAAGGGLTQKLGTAGCVSDTGAGPCADGTALDLPSSVAVAPGGGSVYVASPNSSAVAVFDRVADGSLTQKPGTSACISDTGAGPCADGTGLDHAAAVSVSPDGQSAYVASAEGDAVSVFVRAADGTLTQRPGTAGCISETGAGPCADGTALDFARAVAVSPDGRSVYADSANSGAVAVFDREQPGSPQPPPVPPPAGSGSGTPPPVPAASVSPARTLPGGIRVDASKTTVTPGATVVKYDYDLDRDGRYETSCGRAPVLEQILTAKLLKPVPGGGVRSLILRVTDSLGGIAAAQVPYVAPKQSPSTTRVLGKLRGVYVCFQPPATPAVNQPDHPGCAKTFGFRIAVINSQGGPTDCFTFEQFLTLKGKVLNRKVLKVAQLTLAGASGPIVIPPGFAGGIRMRATIKGPITVNGMLLPLSRDRASSFDTRDFKLTLGSRQTVQLAGYRLGPVDLNRTVPPGGRLDLGQVGLASGPKIAGLAIGRFATLALVDHRTEAALDVKLPAIFNFGPGQPATAHLQTSVSDLDPTLRVDNARIVVPSAYLGPLQVENLDLGYVRDARGEHLDGSVDLRLAAVPGVIQARQLPDLPDGGLHLLNGAFDRGGARLNFPNPADRPQIFTGVFLRSIAISIGMNPVRITGIAGIAMADLVDIDGALMAVFATPDAPYVVPAVDGALHGISGKRFATTSFAVGGDVLVNLGPLGRTRLGAGYLLYQLPGYTEVGGRIDYDGGVITAHGEILGWVSTTPARFNFEGTLDVCYVGVLCPHAEGVVSSTGIGICGSATVKLPIINERVGVAATLGYRWGDTLPGIALFSCDIGPYRAVNPTQLSPLALAASAADVPIGGGLPSAMIRVTGATNAPLVAVQAPNGTQVSGLADEPVSGTQDVIIVRDPANKVTFVGLRAPQEGSWRITSLDGTIPFDTVEVANGLAVPSVEAAVTPSGETGRLSYRIDNLGGQTVTFVERGPGGVRVLGSTTQSAGTIKAPVQSQVPGVRQIEALIQSGGVVTRTAEVASYRVPQPRPLPRPGHVQVRASGDHLVVRWDRVPGAQRYAVLITLKNGFRILRTTVRPRAIVVDAGLVQGGRVSVTAIAASGPGRSLVAKLAASRPRKR